MSARIAILISNHPRSLIAAFFRRWSVKRGRVSPEGASRTPNLGRVRVDVEAIELLMLRDWPDNIWVQDRLVQAIDPEVGLKLSVVRRNVALKAPAKPPPLTREAVVEALAKNDYSQSEAARALGVDRGRVLRRMKKYEIRRKTPG